MSQSYPALQTIATEIGASLGLEVTNFVAQGAFKETYKACSKNTGTVALKVLDRKKCDVVRTEREISAMKRCVSANIAKLLDHGSFRARDGVLYDYVLEEYFDGGTLGERLRSGSIDDGAVKSLAIPLLSALVTLRRMNIVHRDIKPDNIMFRRGDDSPVLVDFGLVRDLSEASLTMSWLPQGPGTPFFAAPEQLNNEKELISWRTDQFSLGVVIAIAITGEHPYADELMSPGQIVQAVAERRRIPSRVRSAMQSCGFDGVIKMVQPWPAQRFAAPEEIIKSLK